MDTYLTHRLEWAILDHDKPGLGKARTAQSKAWGLALTGVRQEADGAALRLEMAADAFETLGAPHSVEIALRAVGEGLEIGVVIHGKPANRMPEASFVHWTPEGAADWQYLKMGLWQRGDRVATRGGSNCRR